MPHNDVNLTIQEIIKVLCPKCTKALKELIANKIIDQIVKDK